MTDNLEFKIGQLYFISYSGDIYSKAIKFYNKRTFKRSDCTHIGIITNVIADDVEIAEATAKGFVLSWYSKVYFEEGIKDGTIHIGEVKDIKLKDVRSAALKYEKIRYGWLDILGVGLSSFLGWKVLGITGKNAIICSEAVARILYDCSDGEIVMGYSNKEDYDKAEYKIKFDGVTPQHIFLSKYIKIL